MANCHHDGGKARIGWQKRCLHVASTVVSVPISLSVTRSTERSSSDPVTTTSRSTQGRLFPIDRGPSNHSKTGFAMQRIMQSRASTQIEGMAAVDGWPGRFHQWRQIEGLSIVKLMLTR
jgi:hypothetical protein